MKDIIARSAALAVIGWAASAGAQAATLYSAGATAAMATPGAVSASFDALAGGSGTLSLQVQGYATLDGDNFWIDILHVTLNGTEVFSGTWDLGGGGIDRNDAPSFIPGGATVSKNAIAHTVDISLPVSLAAGSNSLVISYESPTTFEGIGRNGFQGLGDEGWGLNSVLVSSVPEPATALLMLAGAGLVAGAVARRRAMR